MSSGFVAISIALGLGACQDPPPECKTVDEACTGIQYEPTFDNIYTMTLKDSCGSTKSSCHSAAGMKGGMSFEDEAHAYAALLDGKVVPGDPGCSKMIVRTDSPGADYQMPPGDSSAALTPAVRCGLIQWVAHGAPGPGQPLVDAGP